jgi:WD40 repeat protein
MKMLFIIFLTAATAFAQTPEWSRKYHTGSVTCLDFSSDGGRLLSGSLDSTVKLWDVFKKDTLKSYRQILQVHSVQLNSRDEWFIASLSNGNVSGIRYNVKQFLDQDTVNLKFSSNSGFFFSPHGYKTLSFFTFNKSLLFKDDKTVFTILAGGISGNAGPTTYFGNTSIIGKINLDSLPKSVDFKVGAGGNTAFDLSRDEKYFVYGGRDYQYYGGQSGYVPYASTSDNWICEIYEFETKKSFWVPGLNHYYNSYIWNDYNSKATPHNMVLKTTFTADSKKLLTANKAGSIHVRSVPEGIVIDSLSSQTSPATALAADMRGRYYFSAHEDTTLRIWTPGVHNIFKRIQLQSPVTTIAVSPDSNRFATAHTDGTVALWNIDSLFLKAETDSVFTPFITLQPESKTVCRGSVVVLRTSAVANFGEGISYQWRKNGVKINDDENFSGTQSPELTLKNAGNMHIGKYNVVASLQSGDSIVSFTANLGFVPSLPQIILQEESVNLKNGETKTLTVWISDTAKYDFQWYHNEIPILGFIEPIGRKAYSLQIKNSQPDKDNGIYVLKYWNECDTITSNPIRVEVEIGMSAAESKDFDEQLKIMSVPNPFKNETRLLVDIPKAGTIQLKIFDTRGNAIRTYAPEQLDAGNFSRIWDGRDDSGKAVPSGSYLWQLLYNYNGKTYTETEKMTKVR